MPQVSSADLAALAAEDQGTALWTIVTTFSVLAQVAVVGRLCARRLKGASLAADDYLICLALAQSWTLFGLFIGLRQYGLGKHRAAVVQDSLTTFYRFLYYYQIVYCITPPTIKLSLLFLYGRVFPSARFRTLLWITGAIMFGIGYSIVNIVTDFAVWLMPIPIMWRVQLPLAQKIALSIIFLLGLL
ncbi:hypothetical protein ACCO45_012434 [Purpureocillium lilacinum]|uniref:Uncharacterized protein n=1 Tax=Purpureocillium lilacinum TaxID=33203 RepID=A0ACC4D8C2_PURLI